MEVNTHQIRQTAELFLISAIILLYGIYLGQQHRSMQDLAGILFFILGSGGAVLSVITYYGIKQLRSIDSPIFRVVWGGVCCICSFCVMLFLAFAQG